MRRFRGNAESHGVVLSQACTIVWARPFSPPASNQLISSICRVIVSCCHVSQYWPRGSVTPFVCLKEDDVHAAWEKVRPGSALLQQLCVTNTTISHASLNLPARPWPGTFEDLTLRSSAFMKGLYCGPGSSIPEERREVDTWVSDWSNSKTQIARGPASSSFVPASQEQSTFVYASSLSTSCQHAAH